MKPEVKVFTKEQPCTKLDIWNCFRFGNSFGSVQVGIVHSKIGVNVPRVMERNGHLTKQTVVARAGGLHYALTPSGEEWLERGFRSYLRNHPSHVHLATYLPESEKKRKRRVRPA